MCSVGAVTASFMIGGSFSIKSFNVDWRFVANGTTTLRMHNDTADLGVVDESRLENTLYPMGEDFLNIHIVFSSNHVYSLRARCTLENGSPGTVFEVSMEQVYSICSLTIRLARPAVKLSGWFSHSRGLLHAYMLSARRWDLIVMRLRVDELRIAVGGFIGKAIPSGG